MSIRNDFLIEKRRTQDSTLRNLYSFIQKDHSNLHKANWEHKTNSIIEKNLQNNKKQAILQQKKTFLDIRRKKLSDLLAAEEDAYKLEMIINQETPEQVRLKMEAKLNSMKIQREKERQATVKVLQEKRFIMSTDELRKNESDTLALNCYMEQENQMLDKLKIREKQKKEEEVFMVLNNFDNQKKHEKEMKQEEERKNLILDTYKMLDWQKKNHQSMVEKEKELIDYEGKKLKDQWERDLKIEQIEKEKMKDLNKQVYLEIEEFNKKELLEKQKKLEEEKFRDKELIEKIIKREKALDDLDKKEKDKKKVEFGQNKKYLDFITSKKKEAELVFDKIAQQEAEKQFQKMQSIWIKEEAERIELLKNVYREREEAVKHKKNLNEQEKQSILKEREDLEREVKKHMENVDRIKNVQFGKKKNHQNDLLYQISEKERQRLKENHDKFLEERQAKLLESEYQKKIEDYKQIQIRKIDEINKRDIY